MTKRLRPQMLDAPRSLLPSSLHVGKAWKSGVENCDWRVVVVMVVADDGGC